MLLDLRSGVKMKITELALKVYPFSLNKVELMSISCCDVAWTLIQGFHFACLVRMLLGVGYATL